MDDFTTWSTLTTFAGCAAATGLITQFTKGLFSRLPTQWLSYLIAVILMGLATIFTSGFSWPALALIPVNAVIVSMSANGGFEAVRRFVEGKKPGE